MVVDGPVFTARRCYTDLTDHDRTGHRLDAADQTGVNVENILVDDQVRPEILDLGEQDFFGLGVEPGAETDPPGQRAQHRLERRYRALDPRR